MVKYQNSDKSSCYCAKTDGFYKPLSRSLSHLGERAHFNNLWLVFFI